VNGSRLSGETSADNDSIGVEFRVVVLPRVSHRALDYLRAAWKARITAGQRYSNS
jgi:hypothetical protein